MEHSNISIRVFINSLVPKRVLFDGLERFQIFCTYFQNSSRGMYKYRRYITSTNLLGKLRVELAILDGICLGVGCLSPRHRHVISATNSTSIDKHMLTIPMTIVDKFIPKNMTPFLSAKKKEKKMSARLWHKLVRIIDNDEISTYCYKVTFRRNRLNSDLIRRKLNRSICSGSCKRIENRNKIAQLRNTYEI